MARVVIGTVIVLVLATPAGAQMMTGYSVNSATGLVTMFACDEHGDPECFKNRTELGTIDHNFFTGSSAAVTLAPTGDLVVGNPVWGEISLDWIDVQTLGVVRSLSVIADIQVVWDIAFGPDGTLWMAALPDHGYGCSLFTIDQASGVATEVVNHTEHDFHSIAFVGNRLFMMGGTYLTEYDVATGEIREIANYYYPGPYPWPTLFVTALTSFDGRLWSLAFSPPYPPGPYAFLELGTHDMETGDHEWLVMDFAIVDGNGEPYWTLDLVDNPEQPPPAVPGLGRAGLVALVVMVGLGGVVFARRFV